MAERTEFLGYSFDVDSDMFDGLADLITMEMFNEHHIDTSDNENAELYSSFKYDYLIDELFEALQEAFDSLNTKEHWNHWSERLNEMVKADE